MERKNKKKKKKTIDENFFSLFIAFLVSRPKLTTNGLNIYRHEIKILNNQKILANVTGKIEIFCVVSGLFVFLPSSFVLLLLLLQFRQF